MVVNVSANDNLKACIKCKKKRILDCSIRSLYYSNHLKVYLARDIFLTTDKRAF